MTAITKLLLIHEKGYIPIPEAREITHDGMEWSTIIPTNEMEDHTVNLIDQAEGHTAIALYTDEVRGWGEVFAVDVFDDNVQIAVETKQ